MPPRPECARCCMREPISLCCQRSPPCGHADRRPPACLVISCAPFACTHSAPPPARCAAASPPLLLEGQVPRRPSPCPTASWSRASKRRAARSLDPLRSPSTRLDEPTDSLCHRGLMHLAVLNPDSDFITGAWAEKKTLQINGQERGHSSDPTFWLGGIPQPRGAKQQRYPPQTQLHTERPQHSAPRQLSTTDRDGEHSRNAAPRAKLRP